MPIPSRSMRGVCILLDFITISVAFQTFSRRFPIETQLFSHWKTTGVLLKNISFLYWKTMFYNSFSYWKTTGFSIEKQRFVWSRYCNKPWKYWLTAFFFHWKTILFLLENNGFLHWKTTFYNEFFYWKTTGFLLKNNGFGVCMCSRLGFSEGLGSVIWESPGNPWGIILVVGVPGGPWGFLVVLGATEHMRPRD